MYGGIVISIEHPGDTPDERICADIIQVIESVEPYDGFHGTIKIFKRERNAELTLVDTIER